MSLSASSIALPPAASGTQTRGDHYSSDYTSDDKAIIQVVTANETPTHAWQSTLDNDVITASLAVLDPNMERSDICHHDSGANRHVFHNGSAFKTYQPIGPVAVKGFGHDLSTAAVGRGTVRVSGKYGRNVTTILLKNVLHIPAARLNLISGQQLDKTGVTSWLCDGLVTLSVKGRNIVGGALYDEMYRLNMTIIRPTASMSIISRQLAPPLICQIGPIAAAASLDQEGFYIA
jgi:hypothetical protein